MKPLRPAFLRCALTLATLIVIGGCGSDKKEEDENGGDHLPEDEVYQLAALPTGAESRGLTQREIRSPVLRRFVRFAPSYNVCAGQDLLSDDEWKALDARLGTRAGSSENFGLEGIVNRALATVDRFTAGQEVKAGRVEIRLLRPEGAECHLLLARALTSEFPFSHEDFVGRTRALFYDFQLRAEGGRGNSVPVGFVDGSLVPGERLIAAEYLIAVFLGLADSALTGSYLNPKTTQVNASGYFLEREDGAERWPRLDDDAQTLYGFALGYRNVVTSADMDAFYHYQDSVRPTDKEQDTSLVMPQAIAPVTFTPVLGDPYILGARRIGESLPVCFRNDSGTAIVDSTLSKYLAFATPDEATRVIGRLSAREPSLRTRATLVDEGCSLLVVLRAESQYPFAERHIHGLYAPEGTLKDKTGVETTLPVIYLNVTKLDLNPDASGLTAKPLTLVLEHEFAHFLGFRHSSSQHSLLSPAGYNADWDEAGGDGETFAAFLKIWKS